MKPEDYSLPDMIKDYDKLDKPAKVEYIKGVWVSLVKAYNIYQINSTSETIDKVLKDTEIYCVGYLDYVKSGSS